MTMSVRKWIAAGAGIALALQGQAAAAQECLSEAEVSAMTVYVIPSALDAYGTRCSGRLSRDGFMATRGQGMIARYAERQDAAWPKAKSGLFKIIRSKQAEEGAQPDPMLDSLAQLPGEAVRPLIDALIVQELAPKIALKDCGKVEIMLAALSPLEPDQTGNLIAALLSIVEPDKPAICPAK